VIKLDPAQKGRLFEGYKALRKEGQDHGQAIDFIKRSDFDYLSRNDIKQIIKDGKRRGIRL
jgi:hypothetical protein